MTPAARQGEDAGASGYIYPGAPAAQSARRQRDQARPRRLPSMHRGLVTRMLGCTVCCRRERPEETGNVAATAGVVASMKHTIHCLFGAILVASAPAQDQLP